MALEWTPEEIALGQAIRDRSAPDEELMSRIDSLYDPAAPFGSVAAVPPSPAPAVDAGPMGPPAAPMPAPEPVMQPPPVPMAQPRPALADEGRNAIGLAIGAKTVVPEQPMAFAATPSPAGPARGIMPAGARPEIIPADTGQPVAPAVVPSPGRGAPPRGAVPEVPDARAKFLDTIAGYGGADDEDLAAMGGTRTTPSARALGVTPVAETREVAPVKLGPLDESELNDQRDKQYGIETELLDDTDAARKAIRQATIQSRAKEADIEKSFQAQQEARVQEMRDIQKKQEAIQSDIKSMGIESPSLWTGNTGQDIMRVIGLALIGLGGGDAGKTIDGILERDLAAQKDKIAKRRGDFETQGLLLDRMRQTYGDEELSHAAAKATALKQVESELETFRDTTMDPVVRKQAELELASVREQRVGTEAAFQAQFSDRVTQQGRYAIPGQGQAPIDPLKAAQYEKALREAKGWDPKLYIPGADGYALREGDVEELKGAAIAKNDMVRVLSQMRKIASDGASGKLSASDTGRKFKSLYIEAVGSYNKMKKFGALDNGTTELIGKALPDASEWSTFNSSAAYDTILNSTLAGFRNAMRERGLVNGPAPGNLREQRAPTGTRAEGSAE